MCGGSVAAGPLPLLPIIVQKGRVRPKVNAGLAARERICLCSDHVQCFCLPHHFVMMMSFLSGFRQ